MATVGDLVVKMTVDNTAYVSGLRDSQARIEAMQAAVARAAAQEQAASVARQQAVAVQQQQRVATEHANQELVKREQLMTFLIGAEQRETAACMANTRAHAANAMATGKANMAITSAIYAAEDAASVYGTMGFAGAVRAAGNTLHMLGGALFGVKGLLVATVATIGLQVWAAYANASKKVKEQIDKQAEAHRNLMRAVDAEAEAVRNAIRWRRELQSLGKGDSEGTGDAMQTRRDALAEIEAREKNLLEARRMAEAGAANAQGRLNALDLRQSTHSSQERFFAGDSGQRSDAEARLAANQQAARKVGTELIRIGEERAKVQAELNRLQITHTRHLATEEHIRRGMAEREVARLARERQAKSKSIADDRARNLSEVSRSIYDQLNPNGAFQRKIAEDFLNRKSMIESSITGGSAIEVALRQSLLAANIAAGKQAIGELNPDRDSLRNSGPSAIGRNSREDLEQERQRILNRQAPKDQTPDLLKKLNEVVGKLLIENQQANAHAKRELQLLEEANSGSIL